MLYVYNIFQSLTLALEIGQSFINNRNMLLYTIVSSSIELCCKLFYFALKLKWLLNCPNVTVILLYSWYFSRYLLNSANFMDLIDL